jgi:import inner membrane translocase subunit TIM44
VVDWKTKFDESDNPVIRASRLLTDKVSDIMGGLFQKTELSEVLTEICKMDPSFDKGDFLKFCETDIIPNILEAMVRGDLEILKDWCHEAPYSLLATPIKQAQALNMQFCSKVTTNYNHYNHLLLVMAKCKCIARSASELTPITCVFSFSLVNFICFPLSI